MIRILLILAIILAIFALPAYFRMSQRKRRRLIWLLIIAFIALIVSRVVPGLFAIIIPLFAALVAGFVRLLPVLIRYAPLFHRLWFSWKQQSTANSDNRTPHSTIETAYLRLKVDVKGDPITGNVIAGQFAGRSISSLSTMEIEQLLRECAHDKQSVVLLEKLIKYRSNSNNYNDSGFHRRTNTSGKMSKKQACNILGIQPNATRNEIIMAHRRLIQKAHPDHGGSAGLAAQINEARDVLLK